jgi:hypothetical protein
MDTSVKFLPRNATAARLRVPVAGNPVTTRLEDGVGNCFPGLECDLRNLERRFFPGLEVDITDSSLTIASVDLNAAPPAIRNALRPIASDVSRGRAWSVETISASFGAFGPLTIRVAQLGLNRSGQPRDSSQPSDAWTALRLIPEGAEVELQLVPGRARGSTPTTVRAPRAAYLDDDGALAATFQPGEMTQSLCSPWTHDFRDCACFYWASNHPDIVLPARPAGVTDPAWDVRVPWERTDRSTSVAPLSAVSDPAANEAREMRHFEINMRWQELDFVVAGREVRDPYEPGAPPANVMPLLPDQVESFLRYAAGVELAVIQEYLAATFSLRPDAGSAASELRQDVTAARAEVLRVAISEMRHLRVVNDVLRVWREHMGAPAPFAPALAVADQVPAGPHGAFRPRSCQPLTPDVLQGFINIEQPSVAVDGLYARLFVTLRPTLPNAAADIRSIMTDGQTHYDTFRHVQEWLSRHQPADYLLNLRPPPSSHVAHVALQAQYKEVLTQLRDAYSLGFPAGRSALDAARGLMLGSAGLEGLAQAVADAGFIVQFDPINADGFRAIPTPP